MNNVKKKTKILGIICFILYISLLIYLVFFAESFGRTDISGERRYNLELFKEIRRFYVYRNTLGIYAFLLNVVGNVLIFIPFGFILPIIGKKKANIFKTMLITVVFVFVIECIQFALNVGSFDVDDILLNSIGSLIGHIIFLVFRKRMSDA